MRLVGAKLKMTFFILNFCGYKLVDNRVSHYKNPNLTLIFFASSSRQCQLSRIKSNLQFNWKEFLGINKKALKASYFKHKYLLKSKNIMEKKEQRKDSLKNLCCFFQSVSKYEKALLNITNQNILPKSFQIKRNISEIKKEITVKHRYSSSRQRMMLGREKVTTHGLK